jgi:vitamin B12 transporter
MKHALFLTPLLGAPLTVTAFAQDATPTPIATPEAPETVIVVTAERNAQPLSQTPSTVTVIKREQIEAKKAFDITDLIRLSPGISIAQTGTQGKSTSVFTRGTNSNHTLVLIDGIRANSPADGRFDFGTIPSENIERIEILRGPQSALYGSDAIGGVINIITRRGTGPLKTGATLELGSDSINKQAVSVRGQVGKGGLSFSATRLKSGGLTDNDDYKNLGASLRYDLSVGARSNLAFIGRYDDANLGTPGQTQFTVDPNARSKPREAFGGIQFTHNSDKRSDRINLGFADRKLDSRDGVNPGVPAGSASSSEGTNKSRVLSLDAQSAFTLGDHTVTVGGETRREKASTDSVFTFGGFPSPSEFSRDTRTNALFLQDAYRSGRFTLVPGVRYERNSQFGGNTSGRLSGSYDIDADSKFKLSYGTAFKAPSFNDLYFPGYGTSTLEPEKSKGYEIGYQRTLWETGRVEITAFRNRIRNLIAGVAAPTAADPFRFIAANINRAETQGVEIGLDLPITTGLRAVVNQTFLDTDATPRLLRRPKFTTTADLIAQRGKVSADLGFIAQGRRYDNDFQAPAVGGRGANIYGGYTRFDFTLGYDVKAGVQVYGRFQNIFDRDYYEAAGFHSPGFNFVVGVKTAAF